MLNKLCINSSKIINAIEHQHIFLCHYQKCQLCEYIIVYNKEPTSTLSQDNKIEHILQIYKCLSKNMKFKEKLSYLNVRIIGKNMEMFFFNAMQLIYLYSKKKMMKFYFFLKKIENFESEHMMNLSIMGEKIKNIDNNSKDNYFIEINKYGDFSQKIEKIIEKLSTFLKITQEFREYSKYFQISSHLFKIKQHVIDLCKLTHIKKNINLTSSTSTKNIKSIYEYN